MPASTENESLIIESVPSIESIWQEWSELAERADNLFLTPEWASIWWQHFGQGHKLRLSTCRNESRDLVAIFPLYYWRRWPIRVLRFIGHGPGDELGPVVAPDDQRIAAAELLRTLERERYDVLLAEQLPGLGEWSSLLPGNRILSQGDSPVVRFDYTDWDEYLRSRSQKLRRNMRHQERDLLDSFRVCFRLADDRERLGVDLDTFFRLHREQWREVPTDFDGRANAFQREFISAAFERGWLRLWFLELDGRPVAAALLYRFAGVEYCYRFARDRAWDHLSVGSVVLIHSLRAALEDGMREFRFLRGGESYKARYTTDNRGLESVGLARGPIGQAALLGVERYLSIRRRLRARSE